MHVREKVRQRKAHQFNMSSVCMLSHSVVSVSLQPHRLYIANWNLSLWNCTFPNSMCMWFLLGEQIIDLPSATVSVPKSRETLSGETQVGRWYGLRPYIPKPSKLILTGNSEVAVDRSLQHQLFEDINQVLFIIVSLGVSQSIWPAMFVAE